MAERYPIRAIAPDEFAALAEVPAHAFGKARPPEAVARDRLVIEYDRTIAAFDGAQMIGSASAYSFQLTVPGATTAAAGITYVAVQPTHRRRGVLSGLMELAGG
jgi:predicted N-acetyltransferase YhbS